LIPELRISPGDGKAYPFPYCGVENSMDCIVRGVTKSGTQLNDVAFILLMMNSFTTPVTLGRECLKQRDQVLIHTMKEKNITLQMTQVGNKEAFKKCFEMFL